MAGTWPLSLPPSLRRKCPLFSKLKCILMPTAFVTAHLRGVRHGVPCVPPPPRTISIRAPVQVCRITQKRQFKNQPAPDITLNFDLHWATIKGVCAFQTIKDRLQLGEKERNYDGSPLSLFSLGFLSTPHSSSFWFWPHIALLILKAYKNPDQQNVGR